MSVESIAAEVALCGNMFERLRALSLDPPGVSRASFGPGERLAHALAKGIATAQGCECHTDFAGNLYMTIRGSDRTAPAVMMGSHLDSVPHGGNFDGAAGVAAGLGVLARLRRLARQPVRDVTVMAIRAEEMSWFPTHYIGSRAAFGLLPPESLDSVLRRDTGRSLASHMAEEGFEPDKVRAGIPAIEPRQVRCFLELHIEQGPVLVDSCLPAGIVTGIRGNVRRKQCRVRGAWGHAGAVPRSARHDALMGAAAFVSALEELWIGYERAGHDFVATIGEFSTDAELHAIVKIPGEVRFTIDMRSEEEEILTDAERRLAEIALFIGNRRGLAIDLGPFTRARAALMDPDLRRRLSELARRQAIPVADIQSGGGHDCAVFANLGIPSAMIFVRNDRGSHNPDEAMELSDFAQAMRLLMSLVDELVLI
jgi:N-carbamoyl-L-amino-acid hydrolase